MKSGTPLMILPALALLVWLPGHARAPTTAEANGIPASEASRALPGMPAPVASGLEHPPPADGPIYMVYYWRARPGKMAEYSAFIREVAEPIDEEARRAGVFEEVRTYTHEIRTGAPGADWTHIRIFRLADYAALDDFSAGLAAATERVFPEGMPSSAGLRDLVRQEIWRDF